MLKMRWLAIREIDAAVRDELASVEIPLRARRVWRFFVVGRLAWLLLATRFPLSQAEVERILVPGARRLARECGTKTWWALRLKHGRR
jgi:hypothetical protein